MHVEHKTIRKPSWMHRVSEDKHLVMSLPAKPFFVIVTDGHGPPNMTDQIVHLAHQIVMDFGRLFAGSEEPTNFRAMCDAVQRNVKRSFKKKPVGAVATIVTANETGLQIAHVGDCVVLRFIPDAEKSIDCLTTAHNPLYWLERERIKALGQHEQIETDTIEDGDFCVVRLHNKKTCASIAISRSFGDPDFRPFVTHKPELLQIDHASIDELYAVCSDGGEDVVRQTFIRLKKESVPCNDGFMETVERIATEELPDRPRDDVTIVFFRVTRFLPVL